MAKFKIAIEREDPSVIIHFDDLPDNAEITGKFFIRGKSDQGRPGDTVDDVTVLSVRRETAGEVRKKLEGKTFQWAELEVRFPN